MYFNGTKVIAHLYCTYIQGKLGKCTYVLYSGEKLLHTLRIATLYVNVWLTEIICNYWVFACGTITKYF